MTITNTPIATKTILRDFTDSLIDIPHQIGACDFGRIAADAVATRTFLWIGPESYRYIMNARLQPYYSGRINRVALSEIYRAEKLSAYNIDSASVAKIEQWNSLLTNPESSRWSNYHPFRQIIAKAENGAYSRTAESYSFGLILVLRYGDRLKKEVASEVSVLSVEDYSKESHSDDRFYDFRRYDAEMQATVRFTYRGDTFIVATSIANIIKNFGVEIDVSGRFVCGKTGKILGSSILSKGILDSLKNGNANEYSRLKELVGEGKAADKLFSDAVKKYNVQPVQVPSIEGTSKTRIRIAPFFAAVWEQDPCLLFQFLDFSTYFGRSKTYNGVKISAFYNDIFADVTDGASLMKTLKRMKATNGSDGRYESFPEWKNLRKAALQRTGKRAFTLLMSEYDSLGLDEAKYPLTSELIKSGDVKMTTFFKGAEQYFVLNDNWALWEEMLVRGHRDILVEIANTAASRTTYEKDFMSYLFFMLYTLPEYLGKHTGKKWTGLPKFVNSSNELDEDKKDSNGITRKRSALTPIVDNDACTVTVPYASLAIPGRQTTYCYAHSYNLIDKGFTYEGNTAMSDIEEKLNGKDDYGLMFYTLTGSAQGRGYPTFLIIFERRKGNKTFVHIHRTHPSRSKNGDYNPVHNWIRVCFNWMVGNVNRNLIRYQQGDMVFVDASDRTDLVFDKSVDGYDNHKFVSPVGFAEAPKDSNVLGYLNLTKKNTLTHHEHDWVKDMKPGIYALYQCRSWEANPKGVWSLRID